MALSRKTSTPLRIRLRASFWVSLGVGSVFLAFHALRWADIGPRESALGPALQELPEGEIPAGPPRRLISDMYPPDFALTEPYADDPNRWLVFIHCIGIMYMLLGLNTVCDVYFTGALEVMVDTWEIKPDVAGATFMAAGGSAPELFTSLIGATVESDVGFSTIVGSAVFNILFVIGVCGCVATDDMELTWWPLFRDCTYYIFGLTMLALFASDGTIEIYESLILFFSYLVYCTIMYNNSRLETLVDKNLRRARKQVWPEESIRDPVSGQTSGASLALEGVAASAIIGRREDPPPSSPDEVNPPETTPEVTPEVPTGGSGDNGNSPSDAAPGEEDGNGSDDEDSEDFMKKPDNLRDLIIWYLSLPIYAPLYYLTPKPKRFVLTFTISLIWIAFFSFLLVWWVEILGDILFGGGKSASIIMGFTVLAAGTSIPDAVSSAAVARAGEGDMAVSSSIGSNIFDILVGLPIPWTLKIVIGYASNAKTYVTITSPFIFFYVILLLIMVVLTVSSIHLLGWRLNRKLGAAMAALYVVFLSIALTIEFVQPEGLMWTTR